MYELVDSKTKRLPSDVNEIAKVAKKHFVASVHIPAPEPSQGAKKGEKAMASKTESSANEHTISLQVPSNGNSRLVLLHNWNGQVQVKHGEKLVSEPKNLLLPPLYSDKSLVIVEKGSLKGLEGEQISVSFGRTKKSSKLAYAYQWSSNAYENEVFNVSMPTMYSAMAAFFGWKPVASQISGKMMSQIGFTGFESPYSSAILRVQPYECANSALKKTRINGTLAIFHNQDDVDEVFEWAPHGSAVQVILRKQVAVNESPYVTVLMDPNCKYNVDIKWSLGDVSSQYIRFAAHLLPTFLGLVLTSFLMASVKTLEEPDKKGSLISYIFFHCKPVSIVAMSKLAHIFLDKISNRLPFPVDFDIITEEGSQVMFGLLPIIMYFFTLGFFGVYAQFLSLLFRIIGKPFSGLGDKLLRTSVMMAIGEQMVGCAVAVFYSSALGTAIVYLSFIFPLMW